MIIAEDRIVVVQSPICVQLFATPWTAALQASLSLTISWICSSSCPLHQWCCPSISFSDTLFSFCPQSFPASETFPMSWLWASDDQNTGALALAIRPYNEHSGLISLKTDWFDLLASMGSSWPRDWTWVSCLAGRFFTTRATWEAPYLK